MRGVVLLLAAGRGERLGAGPKGFAELCGVPLVRRAADAAAAAAYVESLVVAVPEGFEERAQHALAELVKPFTVVVGGDSRQESAALALAAAGDAEAIAVHDAARALCPAALFDACLEALDDADGALVALPLRDTVKLVQGDEVDTTLDRGHAVAAQTPQAFKRAVYQAAHDAARRDGAFVTDDAALVERIGVRVRVLAGSDRNLKITTPFDMVVAEHMLRAR